MVDTSKIVPQGGNYLKPETLDNFARMGKEVLLKVESGSGIDEKDYIEATPAGQVTKHTQKPWIMVSFEGHVYKWSMSATANQLLGQELGFETDEWVGVTLKPFVDVIAGKKTIKAIVFSKVKK